MSSSTIVNGVSNSFIMIEMFITQGTTDYQQLEEGTAKTTTLGPCGARVDSTRGYFRRIGRRIVEVWTQRKYV